MRTLLAALLITVASPAFAHENDSLSIEASVAIQDSWIFPNQLITQGKSATVELSSTIANSGWSLNAWHAREIRDPKNSEFDLILSTPEFVIGAGLIVDTSAGLYFLPGDEAFVAEIGVSIPIVAGWTLRASYQGVRGGFEENLVRLGSFGTVPLADKLALDIAPAVAYSSFAASAGASINLVLRYKLSQNFDLSAFATGYAGSGRSDIAFGVSVTVRQ